MKLNYSEINAQSGSWLPIYKFGHFNLEPAATKIIARTDLRYHNQTSDKVYIFVLSQGEFGFYVEGFYGRNGLNLANHRYYAGNSETEAREHMDKGIKSKRQKGYEQVGSSSVEANNIGNDKRYEGRIVWPMGAQPLKEGKKKDEILESDEWVAEEKIDGVRQTVHFTPEGLRFFSRSAGKDDPDCPIENTQAFSHLSHLTFPESTIGTIIDVEIDAENMTHEEIAGHINAKDGRDNSFLHLKAFDLIQEGLVNLTNLEWKFRRTKLTQFLQSLANYFGHHIVSTKAKYPIVDANDLFANGLIRLSRYTINNKMDFHDEIVRNGGEGTMWKNINAKYKEGAKPVNTWYKLKKEDTADVVICGFTDGKGKYDGQIGAVRYAEYLTEEEILTLGIKKKHTNHMLKDGKDYYLVEVGQCSGMTDEQRKDFTDNQLDYLGRVIEVEYMQRTKKGALLHPRFLQIREDKAEKDCIYANQS